MFPRVSKHYLVESSIQDRFERDFLSTNSSLFNGQISDNFIEFNVPATDGEFLDFSTIQAEVKLRIRNADGTAIPAAANISLADGFMHRLFQSHSIFLNGVQTEGSNHFGLLNVIKSYTNMSPGAIPSYGANMFYKDIKTDIKDVIDVAYFTAARETVQTTTSVNAGANAGATGIYVNPDENSIVSATHDIIHCMGPLYFDMSSCDSYLLDNVSVRIRLELASPSVVLMSSDDELYKYEIELCKLWCRKLEPIPSSLIALNQTMLSSNAGVEYLFDRPIVKTIVFPAAHSSVSIDSPFNGIVPHKVMVFVIDQTAVNGDYTKNPNYLQHASITNVRLELNGNAITNMKCEFPNSAAQAFNSSLIALGMGNNRHLLTKKNFSHGRTLFIFDTRPCDSEDTLNLEKSANMRISLQTSTPTTSNKVVFIVGYTLGLLHINSDRRVVPNYLQ